MGIFNFMANAGKDLLSVATAPVEMVKREIEELGFGKDVDVEVEGDKVKVSGTAPSQEVKEKIILAAGNVKGVAQVEDAMQAEDDAEAAVFYEVKSGDTLSKIAKAQYGDAMRYPEIFEANKPMLTDPDRIYPGQVLRIPGGKAQA